MLCFKWIFFIYLLTTSSFYHRHTILLFAVFCSLTISMVTAFLFSQLFLHLTFLQPNSLYSSKSNQHHQYSSPMEGFFSTQHYFCHKSLNRGHYSQNSLILMPLFILCLSNLLSQPNWHNTLHRYKVMLVVCFFFFFFPLLGLSLSLKNKLIIH